MMMLTNSSVYLLGYIRDENKVSNNVEPSGLDSILTNDPTVHLTSSISSSGLSTSSSASVAIESKLEPGIDLSTLNGSTILTQYSDLNQLNVLEVTSYLCLFFLGAPANLIVFYNIFKTSAYKRTRNEFLLSNLVIADSIVTCLMIPSEILWRFSITWIYGSIACKIFQFYRALGIYSSSSILVCISIDRFIAVIYPFKYTSCAPLVHKCVFTAWIISVTASLPQVRKTFIFAFSSFFSSINWTTMFTQFVRKKMEQKSFHKISSFPISILSILFTK